MADGSSPASLPQSVPVANSVGHASRGILLRMANTAALTAQIPSSLKQMLDEVCEKYGLHTSLVVEEALREKLEDLVDAHDLEEAQRTAVGFRNWESVEDELRASNKL